MTKVERKDQKEKTIRERLRRLERGEKVATLSRASLDLYRLLEEVVEASRFKEVAGRDSRYKSQLVKGNVEKMGNEVFRAAQENLQDLLKQPLLFGLFLIKLYQGEEKEQEKVTNLLNILSLSEDEKKATISYLENEGLVTQPVLEVFKNFVEKIKKEVEDIPVNPLKDKKKNSARYKLTRWYLEVRGAGLYQQYVKRERGHSIEDQLFRLLEVKIENIKRILAENTTRKKTKIKELLEDRGKTDESTNEIRALIGKWLVKEGREAVYLTEDKSLMRIIAPLEEEVREIGIKQFEEGMEGKIKELNEAIDKWQKEVDKSQAEDEEMIRLVGEIKKGLEIRSKEEKNKKKEKEWTVNRWWVEYQSHLDVGRLLRALKRVRPYLDKVDFYLDNIDQFLDVSLEGKRNRHNLGTMKIALIQDLSPANDLLELIALRNIRTLLQKKISYKDFLKRSSEDQITLLENYGIISREVAKWFQAVFDLQKEINAKFQRLMDKVDALGKTSKDLFREYYKRAGMGPVGDIMNDIEDLLGGSEKVDEEALKRKLGNLSSYYGGGSIFDWKSVQIKELEQLFGQGIKDRLDELKAKERSGTLTDDEKKELWSYYDKMRTRIYEILNNEILQVNQEFGAQTVLDPTIRIIALLALLPRPERSLFFGLLKAARLDLAKLQIQDLSPTAFDNIQVNELQGLKFEVNLGTKENPNYKTMTVFDFLDTWEEPDDRYYKDENRQELKDPQNWETFGVEHLLAMNEKERVDIERRVIQLTLQRYGVNYEELSEGDKSKVEILMQAALGISNITFRSAFTMTGAGMKEKGLFKGFLTDSAALELYLALYGYHGLNTEFITTMSDILSRTYKGKIPIFEYIAEKAGLNEDEKEIFRKGLAVIFLLPMNKGFRRIGEVHLLARNDKMRRELFSHPLVTEMLRLVDSNKKLKEEMIKTFYPAPVLETFSPVPGLKVKEIESTEVLRQVMERWSYHSLLKKDKDTEAEYFPIKISDYSDFIKYSKALDAVKGDLFNFAYRPTKELLIKIFNTLANTSAGPEFAKTFMKPLVEDYINFYKPRGLTKSVLKWPFLPFKMLSNLLHGRKILRGEDFYDLIGATIRDPGAKNVGAEAGGEPDYYDVIKGRWVFKQKPVLQMWQEKMFQKKATGEYGEKLEEGRSVGEQAATSLDALRHLWLMMMGQASIATLLGLDDAVIKKKDLVDDLVEFRNMHMIDAPTFNSIIRKQFGFWYYLQYRLHLGGLEFGNIVDFAFSGLGAAFS